MQYFTYKNGKKLHSLKSGNLVLMICLRNINVLRVSISEENLAYFLRPLMGKLRNLRKDVRIYTIVRKSGFMILPLK